MERFYRDFLGLRVSKKHQQRGMVFLSSDPYANDHEIALIKGRAEGECPTLINQISFLVNPLAVAAVV